MKRVAIWVAGFVVLFLINLLVEAFLLPTWGLENTTKNDLYFQLWWVAVGIWFVFGNSILMVFEKPKHEPSVSAK